jgi:hypothetical protein
MPDEQPTGDSMNDNWTLHQIRLFAFNDEDRVKADRIAKEFESLARANGLRIEHVSYPVMSQHETRRGLQGDSAL